MGARATGVVPALRSPEVEDAGSAWADGAADTSEVVPPLIDEEVEMLAAGASVRAAVTGGGRRGLPSDAQPPPIILGTRIGTSPATAMLASGAGSSGSQMPAVCWRNASASAVGGGAAARGARVNGGGGDRRLSTAGAGRASDASGLGMQLAKSETASVFQPLAGVVPPQGPPITHNANGSSAGAAAWASAATARPASVGGLLSKKEMECLFMATSGGGRRGSRGEREMEEGRHDNRHKVPAEGRGRVAKRTMQEGGRRNKSRRGNEREENERAWCTRQGREAVDAGACVRVRDSARPLSACQCLPDNKGWTPAGVSTGRGEWNHATPTPSPAAINTEGGPQREGGIDKCAPRQDHPAPHLLAWPTGEPASWRRERVEGVTVPQVSCAHTLSYHPFDVGGVSKEVGGGAKRGQHAPVNRRPLKVTRACARMAREGRLEARARHGVFARRSNESERSREVEAGERM